MQKQLFILALVASLFAVGCGDLPRSTVHGTIQYQGKPVANATVMFLTIDNQVYRADTQADGSYEVPGVPQGNVRVAIQQELPRIPARPDPPGHKSKSREMPPPSEVVTPLFVLPQQYGNPENSNLKFDLNQPTQEWSVDLS